MKRSNDRLTKNARYLGLVVVGVLGLMTIVGTGGGGGGGSGDSPATVPNVTLEKDSGTAGSVLKVFELDINSCPLSTSEIQIGGQTVPALLNDKGEVVMMLPLFYDETTKWAAPPNGPQDVEIYCNGTLLTTLPEAVTVTELLPAPGTTEDIIADYRQIIADFKEIVALLVPDPGIQQQLLTSLITAMEELLSGMSANSLPAIFSELTQDNPEVLALLDAIHAASGVDGAMTIFKELIAELKNDSVTALSLAPAQTPATSTLSANTLPLGSSAATYTLALPDETLAAQLKLYSTLKPFSEQVLSKTQETFSLLGGAASIFLKKIPYKDKVDTVLYVVNHVVKTLALSVFPATLESIKLTLPKTTLEYSEITWSFFTVIAKNDPAPVSLTDLFGHVQKLLGIGGGGDKAQGWVNTFEEGLEQYILFTTDVIDRLLKAIPDFPYDIDLFTLIPPMQFEAPGYTRELYTLYPSGSKVIHPLTDELEWQADTHWGKATLLLETFPGAFGDAMTTSNEIPVMVGELTLVLEKTLVSIPEDESITVGVKLSNPPPEDQSILVYARHTSGDNDISVTSQHPFIFDDSNWDTYQKIGLAAAEDEDQDNGQAAITVWADVDYPDGETITIEKIITAQEEDNGDESFVTSTNTVTVPEGSTALLYIRLNQEPPSSINVVVNYSDGDSSISVKSGSNLVFDDSNWDIYQAVTLYAQTDADTINGEAHFKISSSSPDIEDKYITAVEQEIVGFALEIFYEGWFHPVGFDGIDTSFNGVVPVTINLSNDDLPIVGSGDIQAYYRYGSRYGFGVAHVTVTNWDSNATNSLCDVCTGECYERQDSDYYLLDVRVRLDIVLSDGQHYGEPMNSVLPFVPENDYLIECSFGDSRQGSFIHFALLRPEQ